MTYAIATLFALVLTLAGVSATLGHVDRSLRELSLRLTSFF